MILSVYTVGSGDLLQAVFNAVASVFNNTQGMMALTHLALLFGGAFALFEFNKSKDIKTLLTWAGLYVMITSLVLYPKATIAIEDRLDIKPRMVDNVPLSLAAFSHLTSSIGLGITDMLETVFHMPEDLSYHKTGMLMGSKLVLASKNFEITDPEFSTTLNAFMQQCVFYDLLLEKYTLNQLLHSPNPWDFIKQNTSKARAFPLHGQITLCHLGAAQLDARWQQEIKEASQLYGTQLLGNSHLAATTLLSRLSDGYQYLTDVSEQGASILKTSLLSNTLSQALLHFGANANAPAAISAYENTKTSLSIRHTLDETGRQAGYWLQQIKNNVEAVLYSAFILIYFLSYFSFGPSILKNYLLGLFYLQSLAPLYAVVNFAVTFYAENRSKAFLAASPGGLSMTNLSGVTQANADAMALAGYLTWLVTIGGGIMLFKGLPQALQSMGQYLGGVVQGASSQVVHETTSGNVSAGNASFANQNLFNKSAHHVDKNMRVASGMSSFQTGTGAMVSVMPKGTQVMDTKATLSKLGVSVNVADSLRTAASVQAQESRSASLTKAHSASEHYSAAFRQLEDISHFKGYSSSSGTSYSVSESSSLTKSAQDVSQVITSFAHDHNLSYEKAASIMGQVYMSAKAGVGLGSIIGASVGVSQSASISQRGAESELYNQAKRYAEDHHFTHMVDEAKRASKDSHFRTGNDEGRKMANAISSAFDEGDTYREDATSSFQESEHYSTMASQAQENAATINANYSQTFYEWLRKQSAPGGRGVMSQSAIDNMASHDPIMLGRYAKHYVDEMTAQSLHSFNKHHGLEKSQDKVAVAFSDYSKQVPGVHEIEEKQTRYQEKLSHNKLPENIITVETQAKAETEEALKRNHSLLQEKGNTVMQGKPSTNTENEKK